MLIIYRVASGRAWKKDTLTIILSEAKFGLPTTTKEGKAAVSPDGSLRTISMTPPLHTTKNQRQIADKHNRRFSVESNRTIPTSRIKFDKSISETRRHSRSLSADQYSMATATTNQPQFMLYLDPNDHSISSSSFDAGPSTPTVCHHGSSTALSSSLIDSFPLPLEKDGRKRLPPLDLGHLDVPVDVAEYSNSPTCIDSCRTSVSTDPFLPCSACCLSCSGEPTPTTSTLFSPNPRYSIDKPSNAVLPARQTTSLRSTRSFETFTGTADSARSRASSVDLGKRDVTKQTRPLSLS